MMHTISFSFTKCFEMARSGFDILIEGTALPQLFTENPEVKFLSYFNQRNVSVRCADSMLCSWTKGKLFLTTKQRNIFLHHIDCEGPLILWKYENLHHLHKF